jgi:hypothetical protein
VITVNVRSGNGCAWVGFAGARSIVGQSECKGSYRPLERCVGISVGTGRAGGDWRQRYGGGTREGALRVRCDEAIGRGLRSKERTRRWEDPDIGPFA